MEQDEAFHQMMLEREREAIEALRRCLEAGADKEAIKTLCRETGVKIEDVIL